MADETKNVKIEFENRIDSQLASSTNIKWEGVDHDTSAWTEWVEPHTFGPSPIGAMGSSRVERWTFQVTCVARTDPGAESTNRAWELADLVYGAFDRTEISVRTWATGVAGAEVGKLQCLYVEADKVPAQGTKNLQTVAVTIPALYRDI